MSSPGYTAPEGDGDETQPGETLQDTSDALSADASSFAAAEGIDVATATDEINDEALEDSLISNLESNYGSSFGGLVINPNPYSITVQWVGPVPATAQATIDDAGLSIPVTYDTSATMSDQQLEQATNQAAEEIQGEGYLGTTAGVQPTDHVLVVIQNPAGGDQPEGLQTWQAHAREAVKANARPLYRHRLRVVFSNHAIDTAPSTHGTAGPLDDPASAPARGGATEENNGSLVCTTGFGVAMPKAGGGYNYGEMTFSQCPNAMGYEAPSGNTFPMVFQQASFGPYGAFEWLTDPDQDVTATFYVGNTTYRRVHGIRINFAYGQPYCDYGRQTGFYCSRVLYPHTSEVIDGKTVYHLVVMQNEFVEAGDRGAPFFTANTAAGIAAGQVDIGGFDYPMFSKFVEIGNAFPGMRYLCVGSSCN